MINPLNDEHEFSYSSIGKQKVQPDFDTVYDEIMKQEAPHDSYDTPDADLDFNLLANQDSNYAFRFSVNPDSLLKK